VLVLAVQKAQVEGVPYEPAARGAPPKDGTITYLTLAVTPDQAQMLTLAVERSKTITVALRPFGDDETPELSPFLEPIRLPSAAVPGAAGSGPPPPQPQPHP
jgi:Flp pilus assembly protein CpaB